jgi:hypothetical protein
MSLAPRVLFSPVLSCFLFPLGFAASHGIKILHIVFPLQCR